MPWRTHTIMDERAHFVFEAEHSDFSFSELCRRYHISRPTGYKWMRRHREEGLAGLSDLTAPVQQGKIGDLNIGRLICGGNLISGYAHARDLIYVSSLVQSYFSDEKVLETLHLCEACGVNTMVLSGTA